MSPATPRLREHHRAELVGGRDGGGVEAAERVAEPLPSPLAAPRPARRGAAATRSLGSVTDRRVGEHPLGLHELGADPLAQLLARGAAEGDDQHLLERGDALGDVPRDQGADGPGLAGAGAGLEQRRAGRQRVADVEGRGVAHRGPTFSAPPSSGSQSRTASWPSRCGSAFHCSSVRGGVEQALDGRALAVHLDVRGVGVLALDAVAARSGRSPTASWPPRPGSRCSPRCDCCAASAYAHAVFTGSGSGSRRPRSQRSTRSRSHCSARWSSGPQRVRGVPAAAADRVRRSSSRRGGRRSARAGRPRSAAGAWRPRRE